MSRGCMVRKTEQGRKVSLFDMEETMMVQGEVSLIPAETGLSSDLGRKLRRVHFSVVHDLQFRKQS